MPCVFPSSFVAVVVICSMVLAAPVNAETNGSNPVPDAFHSTKLPLPRFVSLRAKEAYARTGPGEQYPIRWVYRKPGLPVEITLEYGPWRKIRDFDGEESWVHQSLLAGKRRGMVRSQGQVNVHQKPRKDARLAARIEPRAMFDLEGCEEEGWCRISVAGYGGWIKRRYIWGVYEGEKFE